MPTMMQRTEPRKITAVISGHGAWLCTLVCISLLALTPVSGGAEPKDAGSEAYIFDLDNALDIMELCAGCHGEYGQGGGGGEYPRLAGLSAKYLTKQMRNFKSGSRESIAMAPYANEREMPEKDLLDISNHLAEIDLPSRMPDIDPDMDSYDKLLIASKVFNVARVPGDVEAGKEIYEGKCLKCHGTTVAGKGTRPGLVGQYSEYIRLQIELFRSGQRVNKPMDKSIQALSPADVENLLAYLSTADD
jgi:cytochrome c553